MKVIIFEGDAGGHCAYLVKKDLEAAIVERDRHELWGATVLLDNGWHLELPALPADTPLPIVVEARRLGLTSEVTIACALDGSR